METTQQINNQNSSSPSPPTINCFNQSNSPLNGGGGGIIGKKQSRPTFSGQQVN